ncbi:sulfurtransferase complex subunit TusD [Thalassotalea psychrophila]|uniref:Sulfurtransferase complex subunit TusD n=1 Tax=Thalassotalea psychrophila TaxID=3065647 RepID=A0ABY9TNY8_9GAMM|nr:sulfurtransferase complex subunit TusD [Colwelliaceae bacterium SQ149]
MSSFALVVTTSPIDNKTNTALAFAEQLLADGHILKGIFFYQDGVLNANKYVQTPSDELNLLTAWAEFNKKTSTPLHLCYTAGERRGLTDSDDDQFNHNIHPAFTISGLGELVVLTCAASKVVQL